MLAITSPKEQNVSRLGFFFVNFLSSLMMNFEARPIRCVRLVFLTCFWLLSTGGQMGCCSSQLQQSIEDAHPAKGYGIGWAERSEWWVN